MFFSGSFLFCILWITFHIQPLWVRYIESQKRLMFNLSLKHPTSKCSTSGVECCSTRNLSAGQYLSIYSIWIQWVSEYQTCEPFKWAKAVWLIMVCFLMTSKYWTPKNWIFYHQYQYISRMPFQNLTQIVKNIYFGSVFKWWSQHFYHSKSKQVIVQNSNESGFQMSCIQVVFIRGCSVRLG